MWKLIFSAQGQGKITHWLNKLTDLQRTVANHRDYLTQDQIYRNRYLGSMHEWMKNIGFEEGIYQKYILTIKLTYCLKVIKKSKSHSN